MSGLKRVLSSGEDRESIELVVKESTRLLEKAADSPEPFLLYPQAYFELVTTAALSNPNYTRFESELFQAIEIFERLSSSYL